ncbi:MAG: hypothetical protein HKN47_14965 [Pirellulaceae bacterium]|nr:hypothetical protein [Pirellulaceae bacterium]
MDQEDVRYLEDVIANAIADALQQHHGELVMSPSPRTIHLMAKASVAVYESAIENRLDTPRRK